ncbi:MAG TPA: SRPBCC family protein [Anaerolineae bacterium]|nr:SRPBCC family protein [Anaerolineae bacterium]
MKYRHTFVVDAPPQEVAAFHTRATSLQAITPPFVPMRLQSAPDEMDDGDEMEFTLWLGPVPVRWRARIEDSSPGGFVDRQVSGPFAAWAHRHTFVPLDGGATQVVDEVDARLRRHLLWGPAGLAMWLGLPILFAYRGWRTRRLLGHGSA